MTYKSTRVALGVALPLCMIALISTTLINARGRVAHTIAVGWDSRSLADSSMTWNALQLLTAGVVVTAAVGLVVIGWRTQLSRRGVVAIAGVCGAGGSLAALAAWMFTVANLDLNDWHDSAEPPSGRLVKIVIGSVAVGLVCAWMTSRLTD